MSDHLTDKDREVIEAIVARHVEAERERIAQAIEALPGPDLVGIKGWPAADQEAYLLGVEEAASIARGGDR